MSEQPAMTSNPGSAAQSSHCLLLTRQEPLGGYASEEDAFSGWVDVVHVMGVGNLERVSLGAIFGDQTTLRGERREFVYQSSANWFLFGELTSEYVEKEALQLLNELLQFQPAGERKTSRAIIFIVYDLGALIVEKAISLAAFKQTEGMRIYTDTVRFVFIGCFHRSKDSSSFDARLWEFLQTHRASEWAHLITPASIRALADTAVQMTDLFLRSRITLRTRIFSIYANPEAPGKIDSVFDYSTAVLGVCSELALPEECPGNEDGGLVSRLPELISHGSSTWRISPSRVAIEQCLLSLAPSHRRSLSDHVVDSHPILASPEYNLWKTSPGPQILYIHGSDERLVTEAAEQVFLAWQKKQHDEKNNSAHGFSFPFCSRDPARNSMAAMASALIVQSSTCLPNDIVENFFGVLDYQISPQQGWTDKDVQNILTRLLPLFIHTTLLVLQNIDDCDTMEIRSGYWRIIAQATGFNDIPSRLVITSTRSEAVREELAHYAPNMTLHTYRVEAEAPGVGDQSQNYQETLITRLCPNGHGTAFFKSRLQELALMDREVLSNILYGISSFTGWPATQSPQTHSRFCKMLGRISVCSTAESALDDMLRSIPDEGRVRLTLMWLLCSSRPLTLRELTALCRNQIAQEKQLPDDQHGDDTDLLRLTSWDCTWLHALVEFSHEELYLRQRHLSIFEHEGRYLWGEIHAKGPEATCLTLYSYLTSSETQKRLISIYSVYQKRVHYAEKPITPPVAPDGQDIIYYATESFPYHLSKAPTVIARLAPDLFDPEGSLSAWAQLYWAMQNTLSRPEMGSLNSAGATLMALGKYSSRLEELFTQSGLPAPAKIGSLAQAMRAGDEDAALEYLNRGHNPLPGSILWRAVSLDMRRVVDALLDAGMNPDLPEYSVVFWPSPLYLACTLNHVEITRSLLKKGADPHVLRNSTIGILHASAILGHVDIIRVMVAAEDTLLDAPRPFTPLYSACTAGMWRSVETLIQLGARKDLRYNGVEGEGDGWRPLSAAALLGHAQTMRVLLKNQTDPHLSVPFDGSTALSLAACNSGSRACVVLMLEHGADPNDERHDPPLLVQVVRATMPFEVRRDIMDLLVNHSLPAEIDATSTSVQGVTPLMEAAGSGDQGVVEWLLDHRANIALIDTNGRNALFHAVKGEDLSIVQILLDRGSPLVEKDNAGITILRLALRNARILQLLLKAGADLELKDGDGSTAINKAVGDGNVEALRVLVEHGANIHHKDRYGWTPILDACGIAPSEEAARILLDAGAKLTDATSSGHTPLHKAIMRGRSDILKILLEYRNVLNLDAQDEEKDAALATAARCNEHDCLRLLLRAGADVNQASAEGWTAFLYAVFLQRPPETIDLLLAQPDLQIHSANERWGAAIHMACQSLQFDVVQKLIRRGANVNQQARCPNTTPLIATCAPSGSGGGGTREETLDLQDRLVRELVRQGADVAANHGFSIHNPLSAACLGAGVTIIDYLLYKGAPPQLLDPLGRPAVHYAAANGLENFEAVHQAERGMMMAEDKGKKSSLHWAAQFGRAQTVEAILNYVSSPAERRRYVNEPDIDGWTPLCWALRPSKLQWAPTMASEPANYPQTIRILLDEGADPTVRCHIGQSEHGDNCYSPLELATLHDAGEEIIKLLQESLSRDDGITPPAAAASTDLSRKRYSHNPGDGFCDICFTAIYGISYICTGCQCFLACQKCYGHIDLYLGQMPTTGTEKEVAHHTHAFEEWDNGEPEFQEDEPPKSPTPTPSASSPSSSPPLLPSGAEDPDPCLSPEPYDSEEEQDLEPLSADPMVVS